MEENDFGSPWAKSFRSRLEEFDEPYQLLMIVMKRLRQVQSRDLAKNVFIRK